ncbi:hypothetical protein ACFX13_001375 [Malus domestica]
MRIFPIVNYCLGDGKMDKNPERKFCKGTTSKTTRPPPPPSCGAFPFWEMTKRPTSSSLSSSAPWVPAAVPDLGHLTVKFQDSSFQTFPPSGTQGKISGGALPPRDADDTFSKPVSGSDEPQQGGWLRVFSGAFLTPTTLKLVCTNGPSSKNQNSSFQFLNGFFSFSSRWPFLAQKLPVRIGRSVIVFAKKNINKEKKKEDNHNFASKPDEATEPFPESMLLKQKKVQEDGNLLPKFADAEEDKVYEFLKLQLQKRFE